MARKKPMNKTSRTAILAGWTGRSRVLGVRPQRPSPESKVSTIMEAVLVAESGKWYQLGSREFHTQDGDVFGSVTGDRSPVHSDANYARAKTPFDMPVVPGMLVVSTVLGKMYEAGLWEDRMPVLSGSEQVRFYEPAFYGKELIYFIRPTIAADNKSSIKFHVAFEVRDSEKTVLVSGSYMLSQKKPGASVP